MNMKATMSQARQGEIALAYLKAKLRREGITIKPSMHREMANEAKNLNISIGEATEFAEILIREIVEEVFPKPAGR